MLCLVKVIVQHIIVSQVLKSTVDVIPSMSFAISSTDEQPNVMSSNIIMAQSADTAVSGKHLKITLREHGRFMVLFGLLS